MRSVAVVLLAALVSAPVALYVKYRIQAGTPSRPPSKEAPPQALPSGVLPQTVAALATPTFVEQIREQFTARDRNGDGELTQGEVEQALASSAVSGPAAAVFAALWSSGAVNTKPLGLDALVARADDLEPHYAVALTRIRTARRELFTPEGPTLANLSQGRLGDCFCLAPLGALLHRDPRAVTKLFRTEVGGGLWVDFAAGRSVFMEPLTDGELAVTATNADGGLWVQTYEKAIGRYRARNRTFEATVPAYLAADQIPGEPLTPLTLLTHGGSTTGILELITGRVIEGFGLQWWQDSGIDLKRRDRLLEHLHGLLRDLHRARRLTIYATPETLKVRGVPGRHAFAVLGYDDERREVELWNPHGKDFTPTGTPGPTHGYLTVGGRFRVPVREIVTFGGYFAFESTRKSP